MRPLPLYGGPFIPLESSQLVDKERFFLLSRAPIVRTFPVARLEANPNFIIRSLQPWITCLNVQQAYCLKHMRDQGHQMSVKSPFATAENPVFGPNATPNATPTVGKKSDELLQLNQTTEFAPGLEGETLPLNILGPTFPSLAFPPESVFSSD